MNMIQQLFDVLGYDLETDNQASEVADNIYNHFVKNESATTQNGAHILCEKIIEAITSGNIHQPNSF